MLINYRRKEHEKSFSTGNGNGIGHNPYACCKIPFSDVLAASVWFQTSWLVSLTVAVNGTFGGDRLTMTVMKWHKSQQSWVKRALPRSFALNLHELEQSYVRVAALEEKSDNSQPIQVRPALCGVKRRQACCGISTIWKTFAFPWLDHRSDSMICWKHIGMLQNTICLLIPGGTSRPPSNVPIWKADSAADVTVGPL